MYNTDNFYLVDGIYMRTWCSSRAKQLEMKKKNKWNILGDRQSSVIPILVQNCKYLRKICCFGVKAWLVPGLNFPRFVSQPEVKFHVSDGWNAVKKKRYSTFFSISCRFHQTNKKISVIYTLMWLTVVSSSFHQFTLSDQYYRSLA